MKKYNEIAADKVRKSRASYENIYHSTNVWLQRALELICVFLRGGALRYRMGNSPQPGTFLGCCAYSQFIRASNRNHEGWGERGRETERVPAQPRRGGSPEMGPNVIRRWTAVLNQTRLSSTHLRYVVRARLPSPPPTTPPHYIKTPGCYFVGGWNTGI